MTTYVGGSEGVGEQEQSREVCDAGGQQLSPVCSKNREFYGVEREAQKKCKSAPCPVWPGGRLGSRCKSWRTNLRTEKLVGSIAQEARGRCRYCSLQHAGPALVRVSCGGAWRRSTQDLALHPGAA